MAAFSYTVAAAGGVLGRTGLPVKVCWLIRENVFSEKSGGPHVEALGLGYCNTAQDIRSTENIKVMHSNTLNRAACFCI